MSNRFVLYRDLTVSIGMLLLAASSATAQYKIVLRSLEEVEANSFDFDDQQISTDDGRHYYWDQVFSGEVAPNQQAEFERLLRDIGMPLFRIRHRMLIQDSRSLQVAEHLNQKYSGIKATRENCRTKFIISLATFCHAHGESKRQQAMIPLFEMARLIKSFPVLKSEKLPKGLTVGEIEQCLTSMLVPIWFDQQNASSTLAQTRTRFETLLEDWSDGELIYLASLGIAAKDEFGMNCLAELGNRSSTIVKSWRPILLAYQESYETRPGQHIDALKRKAENWNGPQRAVAQYLLGRASGTFDKRFDAGILQLLFIPANYGEQLPHLSAASLFEAAELAQQAGNVAEAELLKSELRNSYPYSQHAKRLPSN